MWLLLSDMVSARTDLGEIGLGKTKITSLLAAKRDQLANACVFFPVN